MLLSHRRKPSERGRTRLIGEGEGTEQTPADVDPSDEDGSEALVEDQSTNEDHNGHKRVGSESDGDHPLRSCKSSLTVASALLLGLSGGATWFAFQAAHARTATATDQQFAQVAIQGALDLANISSDDVEDDVQKIIGSSTGQFLADFQQRSPSFVEFVTKAQSHSEASIREAGLESRTATEARVLVALSVNVTAVGIPADDPPRSWRMRITVQKVDDHQMKLSNVEFVP